MEAMPGAMVVDNSIFNPWAIFFRSDNVEGFVRLLESGFNVRAFRHGNSIILRQAP